MKRSSSFLRMRLEVALRTEQTNGMVCMPALIAPQSSSISRFFRISIEDSVDDGDSHSRRSLRMPASCFRSSAAVCFRSNWSSLKTRRSSVVVRARSSTKTPECRRVCLSQM